MEDKTAKTEKTVKTEKDKPEVKGDLEHQVWYHGFRPRKDVVALLKEPGDFLVRATDSRNMPEIVISVLNDKKELVNLTIKCDNNRLWQLGVLRKSTKAVPRFPQVAELINYYKILSNGIKAYGIPPATSRSDSVVRVATNCDHKLPGHARLKHGITRPTWLIKHENVSFDKDKDLIGKGNFCNVYKGIYTRHDEKIVVAVKICHEGSVSKGFQETKEARDQMLSEAQMMSYYVHNHVIEMFGVACDHPPILIVMEYCPGGDLQSHLKKQQRAIEVGERIVYTIEAARGMRYLHKKNCIHRDLAARNCLISAKGSMKIADFGLSKLVKDLDKADTPSSEDKEEPSPQIPLRWMAPESLRRPMRFSTKTDVWSFGVMMYEIFNCGVKPWPDEVPKKIATMIRKCQMPSMPDGTPDEIKALVSQIWVQDPALRPAFPQICSQLYGIMRVHRPPPAEKFTLNSIPGVTRAAVDAPMTMEETADNTEEEPIALKPVSTIERSITDHTTESHQTQDKTEDSVRARILRKKSKRERK